MYKPRSEKLSIIKNISNNFCKDLSPEFVKYHKTNDRKRSTTETNPVKKFINGVVFNLFGDQIYIYPYHTDLGINIDFHIGFNVYNLWCREPEQIDEIVKTFYFDSFTEAADLSDSYSFKKL